MRVSEHQPPVATEIPQSEKLIFLAGPIQGAPDWQKEAIKTLSNSYIRSDTLHIANPRRAGGLDPDFNDEKYEEQVKWEKHHLRQAARQGAIIFWFAAQDLSLQYKEGRPYAQTSRIEFGRVMGWLDYNPAIEVAIGIEPDYEGGSERYFRGCAKEHYLPIFDTLGVVCEEAVKEL